MAALRASGLVKRFETTCAVDEIDLVIEEGEVCGLLGPNGAGKTTLLRMLFGLVAPDAGALELFGRPLETISEMTLEGVAGFVEEPSFYPYLSGRGNLELLAELDGGDSGARIEEALATAGLRARGGDRVNGYSTGMRQRLGIAGALIRTPRLLLLDEPMGGLDPGGVREVGALIRALSAEGVAVLLSSHQIGEIEGVCDSFAFLRRGALVWRGSAGELRAQAPASEYLLATSEDRSAARIADAHPGVSARAHGGVLAITVHEGHLDPYVLALAGEGIAVRRLELLMSPLEAMFFALTGGETAAAPATTSTVPSDR